MPAHTTKHAPRFDRRDICAAHQAIEEDWNNGGWLQERPSNRRRREATHVQLHRMGCRSPIPAMHDMRTSFQRLSRNGRAIYRALEHVYGFTAS